MNAAVSLQSAFDWIDDHLGAIVVKEARQSVRSRFVVAVQFLFIAVLLITLGAVLVGNDARDFNRGLGRGVFMAFQVMLYVVCVICVPLYIGLRLAAERSDANVDLLFSTTIKPWSVVLGKISSGLMVGLLAISACAPFMVLCYFLRGVDVPTIAIALGIDVVALVVAAQLAVFIAALPVGGVIKGIAALAYLGFACASIGINWALVEDLFRGTLVVSWFTDFQKRAKLVTFMLFIAAVCGLFFLMTAALLSPPTSNRALPVRAYLSAVWLVSAVIAVLLNFGLISADFMPFKVWAVAWSIIWCLAALVAGSERETLGPRVRAQIPLRSKTNMGAFMLYSGAAGGLFWVSCMVFMTLVFGVAASFMLGYIFTKGTNDLSGVRDIVLRIAIADGMTLGYVLLAGFLRRRFAPHATQPVHTGFWAVALMGMGVLVPLMAVFMFKGTKDFSGVCMAFPFTPLIQMDTYSSWRGGDFLASACLAVILLVLGFTFSLPWLIAQAAVFRTQPKPQEGGADARA